ncbi:MAG: dUTP diphosphatase [Myxococcaceae bacterium]|nr:dUTP diphosphatase [Myxococcaceae bacterium]MBH2006851.1 dUTP diphosphatase [Myxococcaceae bacterium]
MKIEITARKESLIPLRGSQLAAGYDLFADVSETRVMLPGERALVPTGVSIALPAGFEAQIRPRSGLALKHGITVLNSPGTIDADYRGEIKVILINLGQEAFEVQPGMRIAQMVIAAVLAPEWSRVDSLNETERNFGGFGSTGA